jgi:hypothetical protein
MSDAVWPSKEDRDRLMVDLFTLLFEHAALGPSCTASRPR